MKKYLNHQRLIEQGIQYCLASCVYPFLNTHTLNTQSLLVPTIHFHVLFDTAKKGIILVDLVELGQLISKSCRFSPDTLILALADLPITHVSDRDTLKKKKKNVTVEKIAFNHPNI